MGYRKQRAGELEGSAYGCIKDLAGQGRYGIKRALFFENLISKLLRLRCFVSGSDLI